MHNLIELHKKYIRDVKYQRQTFTYYCILLSNRVHVFNVCMCTFDNQFDKYFNFIVKNPAKQTTPAFQ